MKINYLFLFLLVFTFSCTTNSKKHEQKSDNKSDFSKGNIANQGLDIVLNADSDSLKAGELETVHFDLNSSNMGVHLISGLNKNADYLKSHSNLHIRIEGNCDERGSNQFNLSLGEKRAKFVQSFLIGKGINSNRIETISFGKERPISYGHSEDSWNANRRANFVIIKI